MESLYQLGWNGKYLQNPKAFVVILPTRFGLPIMISLGLPDYDGKSHSIENRLPGNAGFKFDINLKALINRKELQETGFVFAKRLINEANYRARGTGQKIALRELTIKEMNVWHGELHHWTRANERDFIGREHDFYDLEAVFKVLSDLVSLNSVNIGETILSTKPVEGTAAKIIHSIESKFANEGDMKKLYATMNIALTEANLKIVHAGAKATVEIRLPDPTYPYAFGSIQHCSPKSGEYLELRFKREHLQHVGLLDIMDDLKENSYRNDVASANPEAIRFYFRKFDEKAVFFIQKVADIIRQDKA